MSRAPQANKRSVKRVAFRTRDEAFAALQKAVREETRIEQAHDREVERQRKAEEQTVLAAQLSPS